MSIKTRNECFCTRLQSISHFVEAKIILFHFSPTYYCKIMQNDCIQRGPVFSLEKKILAENKLTKGNESRERNCVADGSLYTLYDYYRFLETIMHRKSS